MSVLYKAQEQHLWKYNLPYIKSASPFCRHDLSLSDTSALLNHDTVHQDEDTNESGNEGKGGWCDDNDDGKDDDKMTATVAGE